MINWLKIPFIIFLCLFINERNASAQHYKDVSSEKSLTQKIINYKNPEGLGYDKIKSSKKIRKDYCTLTKYIQAEFKEDGSPNFQEDGSINLKIQFFHHKPKNYLVELHNLIL